MGPAVSTGEYLDTFVKAGVTIFRLNGAHNPIRLLSHTIDEIRRAVDGRARLALDLPGEKVRIKGLGEPLRLRKGEPFALRFDQVTHPEFLRALKPGSEVIAADGLLRFNVEQKLEDRTVFVSQSDGLLENRRGLHARSVIMPSGPFLTSFDRHLLNLAVAKRVEFVSLSYVGTAEDVLEVRALLPLDCGVCLITKVETEEAYRNLDDILDVSTHILVDRGDLSSSVGIENIPTIQRSIVQRARARGRTVFLATQFLRSMVEHPIPLIAEVESVYAAVASGVHGLQLSEETAIGKHPFEAVGVIAAQVERVRQEMAATISLPPVVWLFGLSGSGKSTLARRLQQALATEYGTQAELLDGDVVRTQDPRPLGYTREDRRLNVQRMIQLCKLLNRNRVPTIVANIHPFQDLRDRARAELPGYTEIYLYCPVDICAQRDPKGIYAGAARGEIDNVIGVSEPFDSPQSPDLTVDTAHLSEDESLRQILGHVLRR